MRLADLAGVGKGTLEHLAELGITTPRDLLDDLPYRYEDLRYPTPSSQLGRSEYEENAVGTILWVRERRARNLAIVEAELEDDAGTFLAKWFGRAYLIGALKKGMRLFVRGRTQRTAAGPAINVSTHKVLDENEQYRGEVVPVYPASKSLTSRKIAQVIQRNFPRLIESAGSDPLPPLLRKQFDFPELERAYRALHMPSDPKDAERARERFIFTEFLSLALTAEIKRSARERERGAYALSAAPDLLSEFERELPFPPTGAQRRVIGEIWGDMAQDSPMNRLLQGDVGSGKTLVAAAAVLLAARNGVQSALMAPTEILAAQHAAKLAPLLLPFGITVEAIFGSQSAKARATAAGRLAAGEAMLAVGTHALITESTEFARLGLAIIDEQHRFGVAQRAALRAKGAAPHTLHMTATPIPRTLAQSIYADLDVSTIDELPPGRTPIETFALRRSRLHLAYEFVRKNVAAGYQAYIVAPAIEESELDITSVVAEAERLQNDVFPDLRLGLLHGRMPPRDKEAVMQRFARNELQVLVATTVIEVGVDVPNASVMIVLDAQRYGLAQLHQLRGRVGRGAAKSFCLLIAPDEAGEVESLTVLTDSTDGFAIAEEDLRLRGPGEFAGTVQAGDSGFRIADLVRDIDVYRRAKAAAQAIVAEDAHLRRAEHAGLRAMLEAQPSARAILLSS
ncbi:MAG TPA: ATP-dependent DNA helicase RecG [Candidatus Baltobacteraceae bacterium]|nr:ATP-dependent DNA helicase RecG [Candidatus Baltobacteraceae bacterium]